MGLLACYGTVRGGMARFVAVRAYVGGCVIRYGTMHIVARGVPSVRCHAVCMWMQSFPMCDVRHTVGVLQCPVMRGHWCVAPDAQDQLHSDGEPTSSPTDLPRYGDALTGDSDTNEWTTRRDTRWHHPHREGYDDGCTNRTVGNPPTGIRRGERVMTRKHYVAIAACIKWEVECAQANEDASAVLVMERMAKCLAQTMKQDNSRFDSQRFMTACGF